MCGVVRFVQFSYYKTANCTAPCGVVRYDALLLAVRCGALLLAVWCGYGILQAVLVRFVWFMRFGEHPKPREIFLKLLEGQSTLLDPLKSLPLIHQQEEGFASIR